MNERFTRLKHIMHYIRIFEGVQLYVRYDIRYIILPTHTLNTHSPNLLHMARMVATLNACCAISTNFKCRHTRTTFYYRPVPVTPSGPKNLMGPQNAMSMRNARW